MSFFWDLFSHHFQVFVRDGPDSWMMFNLDILRSLQYRIPLWDKTQPSRWPTLWRWCRWPSAAPTGASTPMNPCACGCTSPNLTRGGCGKCTNPRWMRFQNAERPKMTSSRLKAFTAFMLRESSTDPLGSAFVNGGFVWWETVDMCHIFHQGSYAM